MELSLRLIALNCLMLSSWLTDVESARFRSTYRSRTYTRNYNTGTRNYRSTRYSSGSRYRSGSSFGSARYSTYLAAAAAGATVYGMTRYNRRYYGTRYYRSDPDLCTNLERYAKYDNGSLSRTQKLTWFVCPYDNNDDESAIYCCGPDQKQHCCKYWDSAGRVGGLVIGLLILVAIISICIFCCVQYRRRQKYHAPATATVVTATAAPQVPLTTYHPPTTHGAVPPQQPGYPAQQPGYPPQQPGYPPQQPGYPPQQPGYPLQQPGYPPQGPGYPPQGPPAVPPTNGSIGFESAPPPAYNSLTEKA